MILYGTECMILYGTECMILYGTECMILYGAAISIHLRLRSHNYNRRSVNATVNCDISVPFSNRSSSPAWCERSLARAGKATAMEKCL
jgi:hypothetical protein